MIPYVSNFEQKKILYQIKDINIDIFTNIFIKNEVKAKFILKEINFDLHILNNIIKLIFRNVSNLQNKIYREDIKKELIKLDNNSVYIFYIFFKTLTDYYYLYTIDKKFIYHMLKIWMVSLNILLSELI
jgi:hypothetical protein